VSGTGKAQRSAVEVVDPISKVVSSPAVPSQGRQKYIGTEIMEFEEFFHL